MAGVVESIGLLHAEGAGSGLIQPIVTVCLKCGVQQGGKQDPSKFMPLCEREEKGCGVRSWRNRIIPFTFVKGPLVFCVGQDKFKRRCHNGSIGMISLSTIDVASFHEQLKAPLFLLLGEMFGYMRTLWMRISCCNTTCYKILSMITHVVVSWMIQTQCRKKGGTSLDGECDFFPHTPRPYLKGPEHVKWWNSKFLKWLHIRSSVWCCNKNVPTKKLQKFYLLDLC